MEGKEEDVKLEANKFPEGQPLGTATQTDKDYKEPPPPPLFEPGELMSWSFYRAGIAEFVATFLFLYITIPKQVCHCHCGYPRDCLGLWWHDLRPRLLHCCYLRFAPASSPLPLRFLAPQTHDL
ncbi:hypothetical protein U1Q18_019076 [Sarracenia purpurea var. burkii]